MTTQAKKRAKSKRWTAGEVAAERTRNPRARRIYDGPKDELFPARPDRPTERQWREIWSKAAAVAGRPGEILRERLVWQAWKALYFARWRAGEWDFDDPAAMRRFLDEHQEDAFANAEFLEWIDARAPRYVKPRSKLAQRGPFAGITFETSGERGKDRKPRPRPNDGKVRRFQRNAAVLEKESGVVPRLAKESAFEDLADEEPQVKRESLKRAIRRAAHRKKT
jgi:hypothetical protein